MAHRLRPDSVSVASRRAGTRPRHRQRRHADHYRAQTGNIPAPTLKLSGSPLTRLCRVVCQLLRAWSRAVDRLERRVVADNLVGINLRSDRPSGVLLVIGLRPPRSQNPCTYVEEHSIAEAMIGV